MSTINVKVEHAHATHRFTLLQTHRKPHFIAFAQLCEALIHHLKLRATVKQLISHHPPIRIWFLDPDGDTRLHNDSSVREALRKTPHTLRLRLRYRHSRHYKSETSAPSHPPTRSDTVDEPYQPSPTTLLRLLNHAENHALNRTVDTLEELRQSMLKYSGDAANLAAARHRLARLYCAFLRKLINTPVDKVHRTLEAPLWRRLEAILDDEGISEGTIRAARRAVRVICSDKQALIHMRTRWAVISARPVPARTRPPSIAPPRERNPERPIKHYVHHVHRLVGVGGDDVKAAYVRLMKYAHHHDAFDHAKPGISRHLCRSIEKVVFHVVKCHKKEGRFVIHSHAARALASSVGRKFERAGFNNRFVSRASSLTRAMVDDPAAVEVAYGWAVRRAEREASADDGDSGEVGRLEDEDDDEFFGGRRDVDDSDSTTSTTSDTSDDDDDDYPRDGGSRRSRSASRRSRSASRGSRSASRRSRSASRSASRKSRSASGSRAASGRSRSGSRGAEEGACRRGRGRSRSRSRASSRKSGRSESIASLRSLEEDADELMHSRRGSRDRLDALDDSSESSSSEDRMKLYRYGDSAIEDISDDDSDRSDDTSRSQWARIEMEREKERLRRMYMRDRELFSDRDGSAQVDVSKRLRHAKDSISRRSLLDVPSPSESDDSIITDEPVRRADSMRSGRSPRSRRRSKSPFRENMLWFREASPREGIVG